MEEAGQSYWMYCQEKVFLIKLIELLLTGQIVAMGSILQACDIKYVYPLQLMHIVSSVGVLLSFMSWGYSVSSGSSGSSRRRRFKMIIEAGLPAAVVVLYGLQSAYTFYQVSIGRNMGLVSIGVMSIFSMFAYAYDSWYIVTTYKNEHQHKRGCPPAISACNKGAQLWYTPLDSAKGEAARQSKGEVSTVEVARHGNSLEDGPEGRGKNPAECQKQGVSQGVKGGLGWATGSRKEERQKTSKKHAEEITCQRTYRKSGFQDHRGGATAVEVVSPGGANQCSTAELYLTPKANWSQRDVSHPVLERLQMHCSQEEVTRPPLEDGALTIEMSRRPGTATGEVSSPSSANQDSTAGLYLTPQPSWSQRDVGQTRLERLQMHCPQEEAPRPVAIEISRRPRTATGEVSSPSSANQGSTAGLYLTPQPSWSQRDVGQTRLERLQMHCPEEEAPRPVAIEMSRRPRTATGEVSSPSSASQCSTAGLYLTPQPSWSQRDVGQTRLERQMDCSQEEVPRSPLEDGAIAIEKSRRAGTTTGEVSSPSSASQCFTAGLYLTPQPSWSQRDVGQTRLERLQMHCPQEEAPRPVAIEISRRPRTATGEVSSPSSANQGSTAGLYLTPQPSWSQRDVGQTRLERLQMHCPQEEAPRPVAIEMSRRPRTATGEVSSPSSASQCSTAGLYLTPQPSWSQRDVGQTRLERQMDCSQEEVPRPPLEDGTIVIEKSRRAGTTTGELSSSSSANQCSTVTPQPSWSQSNRPNSAFNNPSYLDLNPKTNWEL